MKTSISIKEFRSNIAAIATEVENGKSYVVIRRSKPAFKVVPVTDEDESQWETVIDFTEGGKKKGAPLKKVLASMKRLNK